VIEVRQAPKEHFQWLIERAQCAPSPGFRALEAVDGDRIVAMVGYDLATATMVQLHIALDHPAALRHVLEPGFRWAFSGKIRLALCAIPALNRASRDLVERLGFRQTYRIEDGWDEGEDLVLYEMRRDECRWLRKAA
jgi:RimJ/RimL family protein N-acetyltransferase